MNEWEEHTYKFAEYAHKGQKDDSGKDYFKTHILQVVKIIKQVTDNQHIIQAAYLHDTIEDTDISYYPLITMFGKKVADLVMEVTHDGKKDEVGYYFPRLKTKDGILLKFADRLSNLSRMEAWGEDRQNHYLRKSKFWKSEGNTNDTKNN